MYLFQQPALLEPYLPLDIVLVDVRIREREAPVVADNETAVSYLITLVKLKDSK